MADDARGFQFDLTLDAWFPRLVGNAALGPGGSTVSVESLDLHDSEVAFSGALRTTWDRCFVEARGFTFETDGATQTFTSSASWWSASVDFGYALWRPFDANPFPWSEAQERPDNRAPDGAQRLSLDIAPTLGVTWDQIDIGTTTIATGAGSNIDGGWASLRVGFELGLRLHTKDLVGFIDSIDVLASMSVGPSFGADGDGDGVGDLWWIDGGVKVMFTPNVGAHLGYRLVDGNYENSPTGAQQSTLDLSLQGLVAGLAIRF